MTTATRRPRPDFAPLLFLLWAALVLGAYLLHHPLPLRADVPVGNGLLFAGLTLTILFPLWRKAGIGNGPQLEHLLVLPALLVAGLVMLPGKHLPYTHGAAAMVLCVVWLPAALWLRRVLGDSGFLCALLAWFPGLLFASQPLFLILLPVLTMLLLGCAHAAGKYRLHPPPPARRMAMVAFVLGLLLTLTVVQRQWHPVGYLTGCIDREQWRQQCGTRP